MKLSNLLSLNTMFDVELLQKAYNDLVTRIRLSLHCFPIKITGAASFDHFLTQHTIATSGSIICFKEIRSLTGCTLVSTIPDEYQSTSAIIGDYMAANYGFSDFENLYIKPEVSMHNSDVVVMSNTDKKSVLLLSGYAYPYPVLHGDPYTVFHSYSISEMVEDVGVENLVVDDVIAILSVPKMLSIYHLERGDTDKSREYEQICNTLLNLYNENEEILTKDKMSIGIGGDAL